MEKSHSGRIMEWSCNHINDNNPGDYSQFRLPFVMEMSAITMPTSGLLKLLAVAADIWELRPSRYRTSCSLRPRSRTMRWDFNPLLDMFFFSNVLVVYHSLLCFKTRQSTTPDISTLKSRAGLGRRST